jgi:CRP-like cAMP-binding protein
MTFTSAFSNNFRFQQLKRVGLSDTTCRMLHDIVSIRSYEAADVIVKKGSNFDHWHLGEGAWFGEQSILTSQPSFEDYVCLTSTEVMRLPASVMRKLLDTETEFPHYVSRNIAWKFQKSSEMLMLMKFCNPAVRVVLGLAQVGEALAQSAGNQASGKSDAGVEIRVKQEILAALCGVSRTLFSECILKLESSGWLRLSYGKLRLCKMNAWLELTKSHRINRVTDPNSSFDQLLYQLGGSHPVPA